MSDLIDMIQEKFADCVSEKEVCQLYAEILIETEKQMEYMLEALKETEKETVISPKNYGMFLQKGRKKI